MHYRPFLKLKTIANCFNFIFSLLCYRKVNPEFRCENYIIPNSDVLLMLGVTVDDMLKFDKQVANICRKVSQQVTFLKRMRNRLPFDIRENIYMSLIVPRFDYCAQTWHFCNKSSAEKLEKVNERAVRFGFRDTHTTYEEFLKLLGRRTLMEQR